MPARLDFGLSKRQIASSLVGLLASDETHYQPVAIELLVALSKSDPTFPKLAALEDGAAKVQQAKAAHVAVVKVIGQYSEIAEQRERLQGELEERNIAAAARRSHDTVLDELRNDFFAMHAMTDAHERGRGFEPFLNRLFGLYDFDPRVGLQPSTRTVRRRLYVRH